MNFKTLFGARLLDLHGFFLFFIFFLPDLCLFLLSENCPTTWRRYITEEKIITHR